MRATLWQGTTEASEIVREILRSAFFGLAGIPLDVVDTLDDLLAAAARSRRASATHILVIDCFDGAPGDVDRRVAVVTRTALPVHIVHPRLATVREIEQVAGRPLVWLPSDATMHILLDKLHTLRALAAADAKVERPALSPRVREVAELLSDGQTNAEIAAHLGIQEDTVKKHVQTILHTFGVPSRHAFRQLYRKGDERGLSLERESPQMG